MVKTASKLFKALCSMVIMLALSAGIISVPVAAASNGIYTATATPSYRNPNTGGIEDSGGEGSYVLGQSMTESATYKQALVEVDAAGNTYVTVRLQLMDNIQNAQFQVDGASVSAALMQEDYGNNTADYRMRVNSENSVIRCSMYVTAMGRDVIFFITLSNLQPGSADFVTSVTVEQPAQETQNSEAQNGEPQNQEVQNPETQAANASETASGPQNASETTASQAAEENSSSSAGASASTPSSDLSAEGLAEFDASGNRVNHETAAKTAQKSESHVVYWIIAGVVIIAAAAGGVWYFGFFRKKK